MEAAASVFDVDAPFAGVFEVAGATFEVVTMPEGLRDTDILMTGLSGCAVKRSVISCQYGHG
jgi:hypothetical protein